MRDMKGSRGGDANRGGIPGDDPLLSSGRIEPRIGATRITGERTTGEKDRVVRDRQTEKARAAARERNTSTSTEPKMVRDVLLDSPKARYGATDMPISRQDLPAKRERGYARVSPQGSRANRAAPSTKREWNFGWFNRKSGWVIALLALAVGVYWAAGPVGKLFERPIKSVVVEGEFNFISKERATELLANEIDGDFLQLDLMQLKNALLNDPWVEKVTLNRRWPDTLVVKILEQKPIARWGDGFLNQRGEIVRVSEAKQLSGLPWLQGNEADAIEILKQYQDLSQLLRSRGLEVIALKCDNKKSWRLTIKNDVEIAIGRDQVMEKMRRFVTVYDTRLSTVWADVKAIDVRYTNGVAVRWNAESEMAKKYIKNRAQPPLATSQTPVISQDH